MERLVKSKCQKCGTVITLDFSDYNYVEAKKAIELMDKQARECPGMHVEIGGWKRRWQLEEALEKAYSEEEKAVSR